MATDDRLHQRSGFLEGRGEVFPAERRLPGAFDRGEETLPTAHAPRAPVLLYGDRVEEDLGESVASPTRRPSSRSAACASSRPPCLPNITKYNSSSVWMVLISCLLYFSADPVQSKRGYEDSLCLFQ